MLIENQVRTYPSLSLFALPSPNFLQFPIKLATKATPLHGFSIRYFSGTNWLWEMLKLMANGTSKFTGETKLVGMLEAKPLSVLDDMLSPRVLNTHIKIKYLPKV